VHTRRDARSRDRHQQVIRVAAHAEVKRAISEDGATIRVEAELDLIVVTTCELRDQPTDRGLDTTPDEYSRGIATSR